ncbi:di-heme-cytochrome C peroxidase [Albimonas pacifica]|uniref:Cytochrome c domain-containing protein n=1 Tax=Albimonas pacifica TaxID=1114924 RepID=A0A1I3EIG3_9RHOB|nr:di-heme-cytochrome C peroxidase [Albimonas pacifica]SFH98762.1 hypothetical protein SAMN05216258_103400 [Albimonas pacifica]
MTERNEGAGEARIGVQSRRVETPAQVAYDEGSSRVRERPGAGGEGGARPARRALARRRRGRRLALLAAGAAAALGLGLAPAGEGPRAGPGTYVLDQGPAWSPELRREWSRLDQGSALIPMAWARALSVDGAAQGPGFLDDGLARFGFLADLYDPDALPVGFTDAVLDGQEVLGMTCAACHTREIEIDGRAYRADGGPALADHLAFTEALRDAMGATLADPAAFEAFAGRVAAAGGEPDPQALRAAAARWFSDFDLITTRSDPGDVRWGPGRIDALQMISNRLTGLDINEPDIRRIPGNIRPATAPARNPFLWNATRQSRTQWLGFASNASSMDRLGRNVGQVYGVFARFGVHRRTGGLQIVSNLDLLSENSVNFENLERLEALVAEMGPPAFPFPPTVEEEALIAQGEALFARRCQACHALEPKAWSALAPERERPAQGFADQPAYFATPLADVGTDVRQCLVFAGKVKTGMLMDGYLRLPKMMGGGIGPLGDEATPKEALALTVKGAVVQWKLSGLPDAPSVLSTAAGLIRGAGRSSSIAELTAFVDEPAPAAPASCRYAGRALHGVWAAAPYLHNGSVRSLRQLLEPAAARDASFAVGPVYDLEEGGLAREQPEGAFVLETTGCEAPASGDSRCGHEYGVDLAPGQKDALVAYLKRL